MPEHEQPDAIAQLIGLAPVFTPAQAAQVLRSIGLGDITECALRTRAYRKQIPFHLNGHRIIFTTQDLREIAEGTPCRPAAGQRTGHRKAVPAPEQVKDPALWRARRPRHG